MTPPQKLRWIAVKLKHFNLRIHVKTISGHLCASNMANIAREIFRCLTTRLASCSLKATAFTPNEFRIELANKEN